MIERSTLLKEIDELPPAYWADVLDFVISLKQKQTLNSFLPPATADRAGVAWDCPLDHIPNAETIAAMEEAVAGNLPRFDSIEALMADLHRSKSSMIR
jgi:hypothetical protein